MATIKDVARLAGVSVATVSRVINNSPKASESSRTAVLAAMEGLQYHPNANARALAQQSTETLGLIVSDVSDPFFGAMVKAVEQVAYATHNFLLIGNGYHNAEKERQAIEQLVRHRCAALVVHAKKLMHGKVSPVHHNNVGMFRNLPNPVTCTRYHSLAVECETLPECLEITAWTEDGEIMGMRHKTLAVEGVQFHPESILTEHGHDMLKNFLEEHAK